MIKLLNKLRNKIISFSNSNQQYPIVAAIASGLFPVAYYYNHNFFYVNSWPQFTFFVLMFIGLPIVIFYGIHWLIKKVNRFKSYSKYVIPFLNITTFLILAIICTHGVDSTWFLFAVIGSIGLSFMFWKHINKIIVFQLLLVLVVSFKLVPKLYKHLTYSKEWMIQSDGIENVVFKKKPNIYVIQPDGYSSFSELKKPTYKYDNSDFENFLKSKKFTLYPDFRSNYFSTLSSNSSMFGMGHHYYNNPKKNSGEVYNTRGIISGDNPVISIFNNNDYKTSLLVEKAYLLCNRPKLYYDDCNIDYSDLPFLARGFETTIDIYSDLQNAITENSAFNNFYFVQKMSPRHISAFKRNSQGKEKERELYFKNLELANEWLKKTIALISSKDPNSLIIMISDHGGFVGLDYVLQSRTKQTDKEILSSIFSSALAIKWPENAPDFDVNLKTNVNVFRVLFTYLSEDESFLNALQDDKSFLIIQDEAPLGVYETIDNDGTMVFKKYED